MSRGSFGTWEGRGTAGLRARPARPAPARRLPGLGRRLPLPRRQRHGLQRRRRQHEDPAQQPLRRLERAREPHLAAAPRACACTLREELFHKAQGLPGLGADPALSTRLAFLRALSLLEVAREGAGLAPRATLRLSADRERSRFRDTRLADRGELGTGRHDTDDRSGAERLALSLAWARPAPWLALECAGSLGRERAEPRDAADGLPDPPPSRRLARGAMVGLQLRTPDGRLVLHAARRWDRIEDHLRSLVVGGRALEQRTSRASSTRRSSGRGSAWGAGFEVRANWARASRAPGFVELFGDQGSVAGNPALRPESAENRDAGAAWRGRLAGREGALEWARFRSDARDLVVFVKNSASSVKAQNFSRARIRGEEWSARLELPGGCS